METEARKIRVEKIKERREEIGREGTEGKRKKKSQRKKEQ